MFKPTFTHLLTLIAGVMILSACNLFTMGVEEVVRPPVSPPSPDVVVSMPTIMINGVVTDTIDDCAFDGICALIITSVDIDYTVIYAPGMMLCEGEYDGTATIGDSVGVNGELTGEANTITICTSPDYFIRHSE